MNESPNSIWNLSLLLKILALPLVLTVFFALAPRWQNSVYIDRIVENIEKDPNLSPDQKRIFQHEFKAMSLEKICDVDDLEMSNLAEQLEKNGYCDTFDYLDLSLWLSVTSLFLAVLTLWGTYLLAAKAAASSAQLLQNYKLAWRINLVAMFVQLLLQAPLAAYGIFEFTTWLFNRYFPQLIAFLLFAAGVAIYLCARALFEKVPMEFGEEFSKQIRRDQAPALWAEIESVAKRLGAPVPDHIVVGMTDTFYVTELGVRNSEGVTSGRTLYLSYPLMKNLTTQEVMAIVCHELGHFHGEDTRITREFYPFAHRVTQALWVLSNSFWTQITAGRMLMQFAVGFKLPQQKLSRERELAADRFGARYQDHRLMAQALVKVNALSRAFEVAADEGLLQKNTEKFMDLVTVCRQRISENQEFWKELGQFKTPHPMDSHPVLADRMKNLGVDPRVEVLQELAKFSDHSSALQVWFPEEATLFEDMISEWFVIQALYVPIQTDPNTVEGRENIRANFPPLEFKAKTRRFWKMFLLFSIFGSGMIAVAFVFPVFVMKIVFMLFGGLTVYISYFFYRNHYKGNIKLDYEGITYSGFRKKLMFSEVANVEVNSVIGTWYLVFHYKEEQTRSFKYNFMKSKTRAEQIPISDFNVPPEVIYQKVTSYFLKTI